MEKYVIPEEHYRFIKRYLFTIIKNIKYGKFITHISNLPQYIIINIYCNIFTYFTEILNQINQNQLFNRIKVRKLLVICKHL